MVRAYRPPDFQSALTIMRENRAIPLAGGTDLMVSRRRWSGLSPFFAKPVLFIGHLEEIKQVEPDITNIKIGSACSLTSLIEHREIPEVLKIVISQMATPAIRNIGTLGGNICNASPAGDALPVLYALDASVVLQRKAEIRTLPIEKFITGPGETVLKDDELLTSIIIPKKSYNVGFYRKVGTRQANSLSKLSFQGLARIEEGKISDIRISFGAVALTVIRSREIEELLIEKSGKEIEKLISEVNSLYSAVIKPIDDQRSNIRYRKTISLKLLRYFLRTVLISKIG